MITLHIKQLGLQPYYQTWQAMQNFIHQSNQDSPQEIWLLEHPPVFTQGQAGEAHHIHDPHGIPVIPSDRGGQVTYHGPGQLIAYTLLNLKRLNLNIHSLILSLENAVINVLQTYGIQGYGSREAPGVYIQGAKICSVGLRVRKGWAYHGLAFNIAMDLTPFSYINPCGQVGLPITQLQNWITQPITVDKVAPLLSQRLQQTITSNCDILGSTKS